MRRNGWLDVIGMAGRMFRNAHFWDQETMKYRSTVLASAAVGGILFSSVVARAETTLTFVWHEGTCANAVAEIARDYPDKSVRIVPELVPYGPEWHNKIASEFATQGDAFDFAMWDSQSTAEFAGAGHAVKMNDIFARSSYLKADIFAAPELSHYGEYPEGSGGCCKTNANQSLFAQSPPISGCAELTPLGENGGAVCLEVVPAGEGALRAEQVVD